MVTAGYAYDSADRATSGVGGSGSYVYDLFGRAMSVPAVDAPDPGRGGLSLGYFDDDLPALISQGGVTTRFTVTTGGRRKSQTAVDAAGVVTSSLERVYTDDSDNPAWIVSDADGAGPQGPSTTRFAESIAGDLGLSLAADGGLSLTVASPRGDAVAGVEIPAGQGEGVAATSIRAWSDYSEYGIPLSPGSAAVVAGPVGYGFLGAKQRSTTAATTAGLTLMGDRLYNPARGMFTSADKVKGGNENSMSYPADPIGKLDLFGLCEGVSAICMRAILYGQSNFPRGFVTFIRRAGYSSSRANTQAGSRVLLTRGDGCTSSPDASRYFDFRNACAGHDLMYMLVRFWILRSRASSRNTSLWVRQKRWADGLFLIDMAADCRRRGVISRWSCENTAGLYFNVVYWGDYL